MQEITKLSSELRSEDSSKAWAAMETLYKTHRTGLVMFAYSIIKDKQEALDIVQTVYVNLWKRRMSIIDNLSIQGYLGVAVRNACLHHLNRINRGNILETDKGSVAPEVIRKYDDAAGLQHISILMAELSPMQQKILYLRMEDMSNKEIALALNISEGNVGQQIFRAKQVLAPKLKNLPGGDLYLMILFAYYAGNSYNA